MKEELKVLCLDENTPLIFESSNFDLVSSDITSNKELLLRDKKKKIIQDNYKWFEIMDFAKVWESDGKGGFKCLGKLLDKLPLSLLLLELSIILVKEGTGRCEVKGLDKIDSLFVKWWLNWKVNYIGTTQGVTILQRKDYIQRLLEAGPWKK